MAERMSDKAKAEALERVAKLIENNLGYKVDRRKIYQTDEHIGLLDLAGLPKGFSAHITLKDVEEVSYPDRMHYTGEVQVVITNGRYSRDTFKKWSLLHNLNFDKGADDKKTKAFLDKVKELVEIMTARFDRHLAFINKAQRDKEYLAEWAEHGVPEGFKLEDRWDGKYLVPVEENEDSSFKVQVVVVSDKRAEQLGNQPHIRLGKFEFIHVHKVDGNKINEFMRLYRQLYDFMKADN